LNRRRVYAVVSIGLTPRTNSKITNVERYLIHLSEDTGGSLLIIKKLLKRQLGIPSVDLDPIVAKSFKQIFLESSSTGVMGVFTGGIVLTGFAIALGANDFVFGLLAAIPAAANLFQIQSSRMLERTGERRKLVLRFAAANRLLWIVVALVPFFPLGPLAPYRIWVFLILFSIATLSGLLSAVPFTSWLIDLVPESVRGRFFAIRTFMTGSVGIVLGIGAGKFIDFWKEIHIADDIVAFSLLMVVGACFGLLSISILSKVHHPQFTRLERQESFLRSVREPFNNADYRKLFLFRVVTDLSGGVAAPFFGVYMLTTAGLGFTFVATLATISTLVNLLTLPTWGRLCDHYGYKPVIAICAAGKALFAILWIFTSPNTFWLFVIIHMFGAFDGGLGIAIPNLIYKTVPQDRRALYIAVDGSVVGIAATLAPLLGGVLAGLLQHTQISVAGSSIEHFKFLFLLSFAVRLISIPLLRRVPEPKAARPIDVIRVVLPFRDIDVFEGFHEVVQLFLAPVRYIRDRVGVERDESKEE
jgi:MFS family permease